MPRKLKADQASAVLRRVRTDNPVDVARKAIAAELVLDVRRCDRDLKELRTRLADAVDASATTLLEVYGVGPAGSGSMSRRGSKEASSTNPHQECPS